MGKHIFVSYKSQERAYALRIYEALQDWGLEPWLDVKRLQPGSEWGNEIDIALKTCQALLAIMTPKAIASRFVTNEWDLAIMKGKLFIPLLFETTEPHYKYIDIQHIDFTCEDKSKSFDLLRNRLKVSSQSAPAHEDFYREYLQQLYDRINKYLEQKIIASLRNENQPEPIRLQSETADHEIDVSRREQIDPLFVTGGIQDRVSNHPPQAPQVFEDFGKAFANFDERVLLLGEPGAGKTITLLQHARDLVVLRWQNPSKPLPILGLIHTWDAYNQTPIANWLATSYGTPLNTPQLIEQGKAVLLLDGLDELGGLRPSDQIDPRQLFLQSLPMNTPLVVTCRTRDFLEIKEKPPVNGIVMLKPLGDAQLRHYLQKQPELLALVESDSYLKKWLSTPLLLSFFAFAYEGMESKSKTQLKQLKTAYELREFIFNEYINQRYAYEERRARIRKEQLPHTLDEVLACLGNLALGTLAVFWKSDIETFPASMSTIVHESQYDKYYQQLRPQWDDYTTAGLVPRTFGDAQQSLIDFATQMNLLLFSDEQYHFPHIMLRDHFAYASAINLLQTSYPAAETSTSGLFQNKKRKIPLEENLSDLSWKLGRVIRAIVALRTLKDPRAIPVIKPYTEVTGTYSFGYHESADIDSEAERAVRMLQSATETGEDRTSLSTSDPLFES